MIIDPKISLQQNNIFKNKKIIVILSYEDELFFYKKLDSEVEAGKTIIITFPDIKIEMDSGLHKRISLCCNGRDFFRTMTDLSNTDSDAYRHFASENIFVEWKVFAGLTEKQLYMAYNVNYGYDEKTGNFFLVFEPIGNGSDRLEWMLY